MDLLAHIQRSYQGVAHTPSDPFLLLEHASWPLWSWLSWQHTFSYQVHQEKDVSIGHLQSEDIELRNAHSAQRLEEDLLGCGEKEQDNSRNTRCDTHGEDHRCIDALPGDEDALRQRKGSQVSYRLRGMPPE